MVPVHLVANGVTRNVKIGEVYSFKKFLRCAFVSWLIWLSKSIPSPCEYGCQNNQLQPDNTSLESTFILRQVNLTETSYGKKKSEEEILF